MYSVRKFDLLTLEEGEEYVTDLTVIAASLFPTENATDAASLAKLAKVINNSKESEGWLRKGRIRLGTRSIIFEPNSTTHPLLKFKFIYITLLTESEKSDVYKQISSANAIIISVSQVVSIPTVIHKNKSRCVSPYSSYKVNSAENNFVFVIYFSNKQSRSNFFTHIKNVQNGSFIHKMFDKFSFNTAYIESMDKIQLGVPDTIWAWRLKKMARHRGIVAIGNKCLYFEPCPNFSNISCKKIFLNNIIYIFKRQCSCEPTGLEIIYIQENSKHDYSCLFLELAHPHHRDSIIHHLKSIIPHVFHAQDSNEFLKLIQSYWLTGRISNFHYLDFINYLSGRSRHDLSKYPVFPWILTDYSSSQLDLLNPSTFRDLSKPIGALNENRLESLIARMQEFKIDNLTGIAPACHSTPDYDCEDCLKRLWESGYYLYGSHYSSLPLVVHMLIRLIPECQLRLYNGNFDSWNRCFHSIAGTFSSIMNDHNCFYELIPEMFEAKDDFLLNNLNIETSKGRLNNVILPPWAKGSCKTFLNLHRRALESDFVSINLPKWIDLIFGFKQSGYLAVKNHNVFHPFTYLNNICDRYGVGSFDGNIKSINYTNAMSTLIKSMDPHAIKVQVNEFGQIPLQLFSEPHPDRQSFPEFNPNELSQHKPWFIFLNSNIEKFSELASVVPSVEHSFRIESPLEDSRVKSRSCRDFSTFKKFKVSVKKECTSFSHINDSFIFTHSDGSITHVSDEDQADTSFVTSHSISCCCNLSDKYGVMAFGTNGGTINFISIPRLLELSYNSDELVTPHDNFDSGLHSINVTCLQDSITSIYSTHSHIAVGSLDESIYLLSIKALKISSSFDGLDGPTGSIASYENLLLAASNSGGSICLWDLRGRPSYIWKHEFKDTGGRGRVNVGLSGNYLGSLDSSGIFVYWDLRMLSSTNYFHDDLVSSSIYSLFDPPVTYFNGVICPDNSDSMLFVTFDTLTNTKLSKFDFASRTSEVLVSIMPTDTPLPSHKSEFVSMSDSLASVDLESGIIYSFY